MIGYVSRAQLDQLGITYDGALPQPVFDAIMEASGQNPLGHIVTTYPPGGGCSGWLQPTDPDGSEMLYRWLCHG